jgi:hypothetical protein
MHVSETSEAAAAKSVRNVKLENKKSDSGYTNICQHNRTHFTKMDKLINDGHADSFMAEKVNGITVGCLIASNSLNAATIRQLLRLSLVAYSLNRTLQAFAFYFMNFSAPLRPTILQAVHYFSLLAIAVESCIDQ